MNHLSVKLNFAASRAQECAASGNTVELFTFDSRYMPDRLESKPNQSNQREVSTSGLLRESPSTCGENKRFLIPLLSPDFTPMPTCGRRILLPETRHSGLRVPVQHVGGDIGPEFAEHIGQRVPPQRPSKLRGERTGSPAAAWVIRHRNSLRHSPA